MCLSRTELRGEQGMESASSNNNNNINSTSNNGGSYNSPHSSGRSSSPLGGNIRSPGRPLTPPSHGGPPVSPPPSLIPSSAMSMVSMASMLGSSAAAAAAHGLHSAHSVPFGFPPGYPHPRGTAEDFNAHLHKFGSAFGGGDSPPPPTVPNNDPSANECKIVDYRGEKIAAFTINGKTMLCLPQAFELFLKHLVGGLHTVYTKLKRLEITPVVCNVEQVRILRGLGAIQPGVNRCKLLGDTEFDSLYKDCTTSRGKIGEPGRPPKRGVPFPSMSPQDAMLHLKNSMHNGSDLYKDAGGPYVKEARLDKTGFGAGGGGGGNGFPPHGAPPGLNPAMAAQFMALNHPAAFLSQGLPPFPGLPASSSSPNLSSSSSPGIVNSNLRGAGDPNSLLKSPGMSSLEALQRSGLLGAAYFERMREGQKSLLQESHDELRKARESSIDSVGKGRLSFFNLKYRRIT
uniref:SKI/SNO/DAC domain-containing protein n=1 Tax=Lepeophtheirus salmonis TaxID=72036 RepID=A0A0K2TES2_LEPSM